MPRMNKNLKLYDPWGNNGQRDDIEGMVFEGKWERNTTTKIY